MNELLRLFAPIDALNAAGAILSWDRQLWMPGEGDSARTRHETELTTLKKTLLTSDEFEKALEAARADPSDESVRMVRSVERLRKPYVRLPLELLRRKSSVSGRAYAVWRTAKAENNFPALAPHLAELFLIARESADHLGYDAHPYDALLDLFEPQTTLREVQRMFNGLATPLRALVDRARDDAPTVLDAGWSGEAEAIRHAMVGICATMGLSPDASRIDLATSAFCSGTSRGDSRLTTRASDALKGVLSSTLHEMGHALYALKIAPELDGTPLSYGHGLAAHESQSRLWENMVGRSRGFWTFALPRLAESFPRLADLKVDDAVRSANRVRPEAIRVGSDELTYNLHILVRFELEVALVEGSLEVKNLPEAWNDAYERHLGLRPASDQEGVLQDVHWSRGSVGYFPTYAMGNIVGGSLWKELKELGDLDAMFAEGEFTPVREWLTERVYRHGSGRFAREITEIGGATYLDPAPWLEYARAKFG